MCSSAQAPYVASLVLNLCPSCLGLLSSEMHRETAAGLRLRTDAEST